MREMLIAVTIQKTVMIRLSDVDDDSEISEKIDCEIDQMPDEKRQWTKEDIVCTEVEAEWEEEDDSFYDRAYEERRECFA